MIVVTFPTAGTEQVKNKRFVLFHDRREISVYLGEDLVMGWLVLWCPEHKAALESAGGEQNQGSEPELPIAAKA